MEKEEKQLFTCLNKKWVEFTMPLTMKEFTIVRKLLRDNNIEHTYKIGGSLSK